MPPKKATPKKPTTRASAAKSKVEAGKKKGNGDDNVEEVVEIDKNKKKKTGKKVDNPFFNSDRVEMLEGDVAKVKETMSNVNAKLDSIADYIFKQAKKDAQPSSSEEELSSEEEPATPPPKKKKSRKSKVKTPKPVKKNKPAKTKRSRHVSVATSDSEESDSDDHQAPPTAKERETYIEAYMKKEQYVQKQHDGKHDLISSIFDGKPICKPYMYVIKDGFHTVKQKLEIRHKLLEMEYVNATLRLLQDKQAYDPE